MRRVAPEIRPTNKRRRAVKPYTARCVRCQRSMTAMMRSVEPLSA